MHISRPFLSPARKLAIGHRYLHMGDDLFERLAYAYGGEVSFLQFCHREIGA